MGAALGYLLAVVLGIDPDASQPKIDANTLIRALSPEQRSELIETYAYSALVFSKVLKFGRTPAIYLSCPDKGCDPAMVDVLENLRAQAPNTFGQLVSDRQGAQIEVYAASQALAIEARDLEVDRSLKLSRNITMRRFAYPAQESPCWTISYFEKTGVLEKALIYIDSDSSPHMQTLCMEYEIVRAAGVMNLDSVYLYRKEEKHRFHDPILWLTVNAYLHGLPAIKPGLSMDEVRSVLEDRLQVK